MEANSEQFTENEKNCEKLVKKIDWSNEAVCELIELWSGYECLYNPRDALYHNKYARYAALEQICEELRHFSPNLIVKDVKVKMNYLRSQYAREKQKHIATIGSYDVYQPAIYWFPKMSFVDSFVKLRKTKDNPSYTKDTWSDSATRQMLSIIKEKQIMKIIYSKTKHNKSIVEGIATELKQKGVVKSVRQIRDKFKILKSDFLKAKRNNNRSGAKRQTTKYFELLDDIFGHSAILQADGVDVIEMDIKDNEIDDNTHTDEQNESTDEEVDMMYCENDDMLSDNDEPKQPNEEEKPNTATPDESTASSTSKDKMRSFKRTKKTSYQKVVETFSKDWKESQKQLIQAMKEQNEKLIDMQTKRYDEILQKNMKAMDKILERDQEETAKMLQGFINGIQQPMQPTMQPQSLFVEPSSYNVTLVPVHKVSPQDSEGIFP